MNMILLLIIINIAFSLSTSESDSCLQYFPEELSWEDASTSCQSHGWELASIHSQDENDEVYSLINNRAAWIGLNDIDSENNWIWTDGSNVDYKNWDNEQPDD